MSEEGRLTNEEVATIINQEIKSATDLRMELAAGRESRWDRFHGRALGNEMAGRSRYISRDVMDTIESMLPFFIRTFLAGDPKVDLVVKNKPTWIGKVIMDRIQEMLADGEPSLFVTGYQWFKDALITDTSYVKIFWDYDEVETTLSLPMITPEQMMQMEQAPDIQVTSGEVTPDGYKDVTAKVKRTISDTLKVIGVPHWEFLHHPDSRAMDDEYPKGMQTKVTLDYLKRVNRAFGGDYFEGLDDLTVADMERDLDNSIENEGINAKDYVSDVLLDTETSETLMEGKEPAGTVEFVEWYTRVDIDSDGFLEDVVVYRANNKVLRYEELKEGEDIPFAKLSPIMNCYQWQGIAWSELVIEVQNLKTMLMRRILDMFDFQVSGRYVVSPRSGINRTELLNNVPGASISGDTEGIKDITPRPFDVQTIGILEYIDTIKENRTSITKYNQGMDSTSLNHTATGIQMIQSAAMQRMELIARIFAETGLKEMYKKAGKLLQRYVREPFMAKVHGNDVQITPDMLQGTITAKVNMGVEAAIGIQEGQKILQVFGFLSQANQMYPGIMDPKSVHNLAARYVSSLGFSNVDDYLTDLQSFVQGVQQNMQQQMQMQQMQMQQMQQAEQAKMAIEQAKLAIDQAKVALERDKNKGEQQVDQAKVAIDRGYLQLEEWEKRTDFMLERMKLRQDAAQDRKDFALDMAKLDIDITDKMFARGVQRGNNRAAAGQQRREILANG